MAEDRAPVAILGAGINGVAIARELLLNGVSTVILDAADVAGGATAYSSRLIHGGLRYLEYGEFKLVRESLGERGRLLRLAPQFVQPLQLYIPVRGRLQGVVGATLRVCGFSPKSNSSHGEWLVRMGLWMYDLYARDPMLPKHAGHRLGDADVPPVDRQAYSGVCSYFDAQIRYPERFTLAMLHDCAAIARERGLRFELHTYHRPHIADGLLHAAPTHGESTFTPFRPSAVLNAAGAWVDDALRTLPVESERLMAGTKGSHFLSRKPALLAALNGRGIYAEAEDGRPVFLLPFGDAALVGTTDLPYSGDPRDAVATEEELTYLLAAANHVFPQAALTRDDIQMHYCGVRPLPAVTASTPGSVTRSHRLQPHDNAPWPLWSVIGGKLTTCRSLAEDTAALVLPAIGAPHTADSRKRPFPGADPQSAAADMADALPPNPQAAIVEELQRLGLDDAQAPPLAALLGWQAVDLLHAMRPETNGVWTNLADVHLPQAAARWMIRHEWATTIEDLVERRLMLLYDPRLTRAALHALATLLVEEGKLADGAVEAAVDAAAVRLTKHYGIRGLGEAS